MLTASQFVDGTASYIEDEIIPLLDGWQIWAAGAALALLKRRADDLIPLVLENKVIKMLGIVNESGLIDLDEAYKALKTTAQKYGSIKVDLNALGDFTFEEKDITALYKRLKKLPPVPEETVAEEADA